MMSQKWLAGLALALCAYAATPASAQIETTGYFAYVDAASNEPRLQRFNWDGSFYSLVGNPIGAAPAGEEVRTLEVNPRTGEIYSQSTNNRLERWSHDGTNFTNLGGVGNDGARSFVIANDDSIYALNGDSPQCAGCSELLVKFPQDVSLGALYSIGVDGNDLFAAGNNVYVAANDAGGRIIHNVDTGGSFTPGPGNGFVPFDGASEIVGNPALGDSYAAAQGRDKGTMTNGSGTNWIITGDQSGFATGTFDANNTGTGAEFINDIEVGPDGAIYTTWYAAPLWLGTWEDRGPAQTPNLSGGCCGNGEAWLDLDPSSVPGNATIHVATNDGPNTVLRAWSSTGATSNADFVGQFPIDAASRMLEIAILGDPVIPEPSSLGLAVLGLLALAGKRRRV